LSTLIDALNYAREDFLLRLLSSRKVQQGEDGSEGEMRGIRGAEGVLLEDPNLFGCQV